MAKNIDTLIKEYGLESKEGYYSLVLEQYLSNFDSLISMFNDMKKDNKAEMLNVYMEETFSIWCVATTKSYKLKQMFNWLYTIYIVVCR